MADGSVKLFFEEITGQAGAAASAEAEAEAEAAGETRGDEAKLREVSPERLHTKATLSFRWHALAASGDRPAPRGGHTLTRLADGRLVLFGGADRSGSAMGGVHEAVVDTAAGTVRWTRREAGGEAPPPRSGHTAVAAPDGSRLFVYGGLAGEEFLDDVWELDCGSFAWRRVQTSGAAPRRNGHSALLVGRRTMVVLGGSDRVPQGGVHALDLESGRWRRLRTEGEAGPAREMHSAAVLPADPASGRVTVCLVGGRTREALAGAAVCLDVPLAVDEGEGDAVCAWRAAGDCPPLCGHAAVPVGNCVAVYGGTDGASFSDSLVFGTRGLAAVGSACAAADWRDVNPRAAKPKRGGGKAAAPEPRFVHTLTPLETGATLGHFSYALFGGINPGAEFGDAFELRVQPGMVAE